jgi:hypothetical protein
MAVKFPIDKVSVLIMGALLKARYQAQEPFLSISDIHREVKSARTTIEKRLIRMERILGQTRKGPTVLFFIKDEDFLLDNPEETVERLVLRLRELFGKFRTTPVRRYLVSCCTGGSKP